MDDAAETRRLLDRWRAGDEEAARTLFNRYVDRLAALARRRLSQRLAPRVDPEDITQSVFRTFFGRLKAGHFAIEDQNDLWKLLVRITIHKTLRQVEFQKADKRDPSRETPQSDPARQALMTIFDRDPTPDAVVGFCDQLEHFLGQLKPQEREILELSLAGHSHLEIAEKLGTYDRKIRRVLERIRGVAERQELSPGKGK